MAKISFEIEVPDRINPDYVRQHGQEVLDRLIEESRSELAEYDLRERALTSDEALQEWMEKTFFRDDQAPIMRALTYSGTNICPRRELWRRGPFWNDPRRPVIMRGAREIRNNKGSRKSDWPNKVIRRYYRRIRYTCLDFEENQIKAIKLSEALRFQRPDWASLDVLWSGGEMRAWVNGEQVWLSKDRIEQISRMQGIVNKVDRLEIAS